MTRVLEERRMAQVGMDHSTLKAEIAGTDTRYTIALTGRLDDRWIEACRAAQAESTGFRRFRLDPASRTVFFSCRTVDGTTQVFDALDRLEALLKLVNQIVEELAGSGKI